MISTELLCKFIEITVPHRSSPVNLQHIFRITFHKNTLYIRTPESNHFWHFQVIPIEAVHSSQENCKTIPKQLLDNEFHDRSFSFEFERKQ